MKYSPSARGFYDPDYHPEGAIPEDALDVSPEDYQALLAGQSQGHEIVPGSDGAPVLREPTLSSAELLQRLQVQARNALAEGDKVATRCIKFGVAYPQAWRDRDASMVAVIGLPADADPGGVVIEPRPPYPDGTGWPEG